MYPDHTFANNREGAMRGKNKIRLIALVLMLLFLSSCTMLSIKNTTTGNLQVVVKPPDSDAANFFLVKAGDVKNFNSVFGGSFSVTIIPGEGFLSALKARKEALETQMVIAELSPDALAEALKDILQIQELIDHEKTNPVNNSASCSGVVQDFGTASAEIFGSDPNSYPKVACTVQNPALTGDDWLSMISLWLDN
jgi:hypothetical protein